MEGMPSKTEEELEKDFDKLDSEIFELLKEAYGLIIKYNQPGKDKLNEKLVELDKQHIKITNKIIHKNGPQMTYAEGIAQLTEIRSKLRLLRLPLQVFQK